MDTLNQSIKTVSRSHFVTILAWIFIVLSGFATFISILQNIMIGYFFPLEKMQQAFSRPEVQDHIPVFFTFMFSHISLIFLSFLVLSSAGIASSIGLLKRKNWARIVFIILMSLGIIWNVGGVLLQQIMLSSFPTMIPESQSRMPQFESMMVVIKIFTIVLAVGFSLLFGWIIKKLISPSIRAEFTT